MHWTITKTPRGRYDGVDEALPGELRIDGPDTEATEVIPASELERFAERVAWELEARAENAVAAGERCREAFPEKARRYEDRGRVLREAAQHLLRSVSEGER